MRQEENDDLYLVLTPVAVIRFKIDTPISDGSNFLISQITHKNEHEKNTEVG